MTKTTSQRAKRPKRWKSGCAWVQRGSAVRRVVASFVAGLVPAVFCGVVAAVSDLPDDRHRASGFDYSWLTSESYASSLAFRQTELREAEALFESAQIEVQDADVIFYAAAHDVSRAWARYLSGARAGDSEAALQAWRDVGTALSAYRDARWAKHAAVENLADARETLGYERFWKAELENDWREAQAERGVAGARTVAEEIARCGNGPRPGCSAAERLRSDTRFTVFQPILATVGVHHAHALGLTGAGVRVAVEDDAVAYRSREFSGRVSFEGARLVYPRPRTAVAPYDAAKWSYESSSYAPWETEDPHLHESLTVDYIAFREEGFNEEIWLENRADDVLSYHRWVVIPAIHAEDGPSHGTRVASVAVGRDFGVAPGATLIPIFKDFSKSGQREQSSWSRFLLDDLSRASTSRRRAWDEYLAAGVRADYANYDIVNRSFGIGVFDPESVRAVLGAGENWWGEELRKLLPLTWRAYMQTDVHPDERALVVYAAGNELEEYGGLGADLPYYERHVRGHQISVMALGEDGVHAVYSNFCGRLPANWDSARWGRHYCLAAPGTVNATSNRPDYAYQGTEGTSFAAPIVTGALALLIERFRGQVGHTAIAKRLVDTADNTGRYAQVEIYGAGRLDLQAALSPVGRLTTGTPTVRAGVDRTRLIVPAAFAGLSSNLAGLEVAGLDEWGAPFWFAPDTMFASLATADSLLPRFVEPDPIDDDLALPVADLHLGFTPGTLPFRMGSGLSLLAGKNRIGLEFARRGGWLFGALGNRDGWLGGRSAGAFGRDIRSITAWAGRDLDVSLSGDWRLRGHATLGVGSVSLASGAMVQAEPALLSAWSVGLEHGARGAERWSRIGLSQPLRAETGHARLTYLAGLADGEPDYRTVHVPLAPAGRMVELSLGHEHDLGAGRLALTIGYAIDADHVDHARRGRIGAAYRFEW